MFDLTFLSLSMRCYSRRSSILEFFSFICERTEEERRTQRLFGFKFLPLSKFYQFVLERERIWRTEVFGLKFLLYLKFCLFVLEREREFVCVLSQSLDARGNQEGKNSSKLLVNFYFYFLIWFSNWTMVLLYKKQNKINHINFVFILQTHLPSSSASSLWQPSLFLCERFFLFIILNLTDSVFGELISNCMRLSSIFVLYCIFHVSSALAMRIEFVLWFGLSVCLRWKFSIVIV